jgi:hypothetical protein
MNRATAVTAQIQAHGKLIDAMRESLAAQS